MSTLALCLLLPLPDLLWLLLLLHVMLRLRLLMMLPLWLLHAGKGSACPSLQCRYKLRRRIRRRRLQQCLRKQWQDYVWLWGI